MLEVNLQRALSGLVIDAAFRAEPGSISALFGRSGAGKTTLINMISGLVEPDSGLLKINGRTLFDSLNRINTPIHDRNIGYVFQDSRLFPHMSVHRNLLYGAKGRSTSATELGRIVELLDLGILLQRRPRTLSGGERQRVAIGRALLSRPRLLLMDEPLASIDIQRRGEILPFLERLRDETSSAIVYVSHEIEEVIRLADTLHLISNGRIVASGGVEELMSRLDLKPMTGRYEAGAVISMTYDYYEAEFGIGHLNFNGGTLRVAGLEMERGGQIRAHIRARDVSLALKKPEDISVLNVFEGTIDELSSEDGPQLDIRVDVGSKIIARLTRKSVHDLGLIPGKKVFAMIKAVAIDRRSLGGQGRPSR